MKKRTKTTALLVLTIISLISVIFYSCSSGEKTNSNDPVDPVNAGNESPDSGAETATEISDDLEPADYGGANFRILYRNSCQRSNWALYEVHKIEIATEAENGDVINDALYKRNKNIEERFNVNIVGIP